VAELLRLDPRLRVRRRHVLQPVPHGARWRAPLRRVHEPPVHAARRRRDLRPHQAAHRRQPVSTRSAPTAGSASRTVECLGGVRVRADDCAIPAPLPLRSHAGEGGTRLIDNRHARRYMATELRGSHGPRPANHLLTGLLRHAGPAHRWRFVPGQRRLRVAAACASRGFAPEDVHAEVKALRPGAGPRRARGFSTGNEVGLHPEGASRDPATWSSNADESEPGTAKDRLPDGELAAHGAGGGCASRCYAIGGPPGLDLHPWRVRTARTQRLVEAIAEIAPRRASWGDRPFGTDYALDIQLYPRPRRLHLRRGDRGCWSPWRAKRRAAPAPGPPFSRRQGARGAGRRCSTTSRRWPTCRGSSATAGAEYARFRNRALPRGTAPC